MKDILPAGIIKEYNSTRGLFRRGKLCHAPFNSLRFSLSGNIYSCCYNRFHSLGKYPDASISDAWFGMKADELRSMINENDLSSGCHACFSKIIGGNYNSAGARIYDGYRSRKKGPSLMEFEITNKCNLECAMCNGENSSLIRKNREKGEPYPLVYDEKFVEQLTEFVPYLKEARFVGGEPFIESIYFSIWEMIASKNRGTLISILTNGTILNDKIIEFYKNNKVTISFSIDSVNRKTYEAIRVNADFEKVMDNFRTVLELSKEYRRGINVNICPLRINMKEMPEIINFFTALDVKVVIHTVVYPPALAINTLTKSELEDYLAFLEGDEIIKGRAVSAVNELAFTSFKLQVSGWIKTATEKEYTGLMLTDEIKSNLYDRVKSYCHQKGLKHEKYISLLENVLTKIDGDEARRQALIALQGIEAGYIVSEIETSTEDKIRERLMSMVSG